MNTQSNILPADQTIAPSQPCSLSQLSRLANVFLSPAKTFRDIFRSHSWWLPFLVISIAGYIYGGVIVKRVGLDQVVANSAKDNPQFSEASPEVQAQSRSIALRSIQISLLATPLVILAIAALSALVLRLCLNLFFGGQATFPALFSVLIYANLISLTKVVIAIFVLLVGNDPAAFELKNPVATNAAAFLGSDSAQWLRSLVTSLDLVTIWYLVVLTLGCAIVARLKISQAAIVVFGWWGIITIISVAWVAIT